MDKDPFEECRISGPDRSQKEFAWKTAAGLQAVDGLQPSAYLIKTAGRNINGEITFDEASESLLSYYRKNRPADASDRTEEADIVSMRIAALLCGQAFSFSPNEYLSIHRKLFSGIFRHAGQIRDYSIAKKEWILEGGSVIYGCVFELRAALDYDFQEEKRFSYRNLSMDEIIHRLACFISRLWQIHIFGEGNTRTTAVFLIRYLRFLGFDEMSDVFARNAWYFRNALVRANYNDPDRGIHETTEYLETFLRSLLLNEEHPLDNETMHISRRPK